jgi:hypothetical protein
MFGKKAQAIYDTLVAEFGDENLSAIDRVYLEQACRLISRTFRIKPKDSALAIKCQTEARRLLETVCKRALKTVETSQASSTSHLFTAMRREALRNSPPDYPHGESTYVPESERVIEATIVEDQTE